ncbi:MAG: HNH endonuclease [Deltaproteobacteria bacterium]|nr:HNH endonuclease [Kofleriaceae bacterium]
MGLEEIDAFLFATLGRDELPWEAGSISAIAALGIPDGMLGVRGGLLRADVRLLWARWFVEAICDPERFARSGDGYAHIVRTVHRRTHALFPTYPADERDVLALKLARLVNDEVQRRQRLGRTVLSKATRADLLAEAGARPRCWVCGLAFAERAIEAFLGHRSVSDEAGLPVFLDFLKPSGLQRRDHQIEVDHVMPVTHGGQDGHNLRLACGWCNGHKGGRISLYDVMGRPTVFEHPTLGAVSATRPFWVVRLLALRRRCEWNGTGGCLRTSENSELTVCPHDPVGAMNPINLRVTCAEHDPIGLERLVARDRFRPASA